MDIPTPASTGRQYKNYAFISYSRRDEQIVAWLHKAIEGFRIPTRLPLPPSVEKPPRHLRPLFRDRTDLEVQPHPFVKQIECELADSRFLIVVCSPKTAHPHSDGTHYVDWEIRRFIQAHGEPYGRSHILAVILDGAPGCSDPNRECLPPALLELGADFLAHNFPSLKNLPKDRKGEAEEKEHCLIDIISFLLRVEKSVLSDRYQRAHRERLRKFVGASIVIVLTLIGFLAWALVEQCRAEAARQKTLQTLAQADFEEASRFLDDSHDTSRALAFLGSSLSQVPFPPAENRLQGLILQRSWLVEGEQEPLPKGKDKSFVVAPGLDRLIRFQQGDAAETASGLMRASLHPLFSDGKDPDTLLSSAAQFGFFSADGSVWLSSAMKKGRVYCSFWNARKGQLLGGFLAEAGENIIATSPSGNFALLQNKEAGLSLVRSADGQRVGTVALEAGWRWMNEPQEPPLIAFSQDESALILVDRTGNNDPIASRIAGIPTSLQPQNRTRFRIRCYRTKDWRETMREEQPGAVSRLISAPDAAFVIYAASANAVEGWQLVLHPLTEGIDAWKQKVPIPPGNLLISPDGTSLVVADEDQLSLRDPYMGGEARFNPITLRGPVRGLAYSHDGRRLAFVTQSPEVGVINTETGVHAVEPRLFDGRITGLAFSRNDRTLRIQTENAIRSFALQASPLAPRLITPSSQLPIRQVASDPLGRGLAFASSDAKNAGAVELRTPEGGPWAPPCPIGEPVNGIAFSPNGKTLAVAAGHLLAEEKKSGSLWLYEVPESIGKADTMEPGRGRRIEIASGALQRIQFSPDGKWVLLKILHPSGAATFELFDLNKETLRPSFITHGANLNVTSAVFSFDGRRLVTTGGDQKVRIWDLQQGRLAGESAALASFPESVDISPNGKQIVVGERFIHEQGELMLLSISGAPVWSQPRRFMSGVQGVKFSPEGDVIAVSFFDHSVVVCDALTGRPRTAPLPHEQPITGMRFLPVKGRRSILAVACGWDLFSQGEKETDDRGYVELWDTSTGLKQGDRLRHKGSVIGLDTLADGRLISWNNTNALVTSLPVMREEDGKEKVDFPAITAALGGWGLNQWRAPEATAHRGRWAELAKGAPAWQSLMAWLATLPEARSMEPGGGECLRDRLAGMASQDGVEGCRNVLDLKPDDAHAMAQYWFSAAMEAAKEAFMAPTQGRSREEILQREMEWSRILTNQGRGKIFSYPKARRLAEFWTRELCAKHPEQALAWTERGNFLRLAGDNAGAIAALNKALEITPGDFDSREQMALLEAQQGDIAGAAGDFDLLCAQLEKNPPSSSDQAIRVITQTGLSRLRIGSHVKSPDLIERDVRWIVEQLEKVLRPIKRLSRDSIERLMNASDKLSDFLLQTDGSPALLAEINTRLLAALEDKAGPPNLNAMKSTLLGVTAFAQIILGNTCNARINLDEALRISPDLWALHIYRAHALAAAGRAEKARAIYTEILEMDATFNGTISHGIALDWQHLKKLGIPLPGLESFQRELTQKLLSKSGAGLLITAIRPGSQSEGAGIKVGDRLLSYEGEPVLDLQWFIWERQVEHAQKMDAPRTMVIVRDGQQQTLTIKAGPLGMELQSE